MKLDDITIEVRDRNLTRVGTLTKGFKLEATPLHNKVGTWTLTLPADNPLSEVLREPGSGIVVTGPDDIIISGPVTAPAKSVTTQDPGGSLAFTGSCDNQWVADYLAWPEPDNPDSMTQAFDYDEREGAAETVMHGYVNANIGPAAPDGRRIERLTMGPDLGRPENADGFTHKAARFDELDTLISGIAGAAGLTWRVVQRGNRLRFETNEVRDLSRLVRLDTRNNTLSGYKLVTSAPTATHAIVGAQDVEDDRIFATVTTDDSELASAAWGRRIERFVSQSYVEDEDEFTATAREMLADEGKTVTSVQAIPNDDESLRFGRDYRLGDKIGMVADDREYASVVTGMVLKVDEAGVRIALVLGDASAFNQTLATKVTIDRVDARVKSLQRNAIIGKPNAVIDVKATADAAQTAADAAQTAADAAQSTADGAQTTADTKPDDADVTAAADAAQAAAEAVADAAQATANSKTKTFRQAGIPTSLTIGDEWIDTDDENKRYLAASVGADAITAGEWEHVPTRVLSTADSGERVVIRNDGGGGIIESFSGASGETAGFIDPAIGTSGRPRIRVAPGLTGTYNKRPLLEMVAGSSGSEVHIEAATVHISDDAGEDGALTVDGNFTAGRYGFGAGMDSWQVACSSDATTASTTNVTISGLSQVVTSPGTSAVYIVTINAAVLIQASTENTIELLVDGSAQTAKLITTTGTAAMQCPGSQTWRITGLSAGSHTFTARTRNSVGTSTTTIKAAHTLMTIERKG